MEGLRSTSAANWVMVAGGGGGGARCGAARRVLHFRAPIGGAQHGGAFSRVLIWRRATAVAPAFPRPPSPFSAFPSPEKQEEVKTDKDASSVETQTASDPPAAAAAATEQSAEAVLQPQAPTEPLEAASSESQETSEAEPVEAETDAARETPSPGESQETSELETVVVAETDAQNDDPRTVRVRFTLQKSCRFGEQFLLVGEHQILGSWNPDKAIPMEWSDGHVWVTDDVELPVGEEIKYKFILRPLSGKIKWQPGEDKVLQTCESAEAEAAIVVTGDWESPDDEKTTEKEKASDDVTAAGSDGADATESKQEAEDEVVHEDLKSTAVEAGDQEKRVVHEGEPVLVPGFATVAASATEA